MIPTQLATIVQELAAEEFRKVGKLTPVIPSGFESIFYELQIVLEVTMLSRGISFVLGIPMNSKSATYNVFQGKPLYQRNDDGKTASVYQFPKPNVAISTDNTNFAEIFCYNNAREVIESNCAEKAFRPLPMKRYSV